MIHRVRKAFITIVVAGILLAPRDARAVTYSYTRTDADAVGYGISLMQKGMLAVEFTPPNSAGVYYASGVMYTDGTLAGTRTIASAPANNTTIEMAGYGRHSRTYDAVENPQDGQPRGGHGLVRTPILGAEYFRTSIFDGGPFGDDFFSVQATQGDSGGYVGDFDGNLIGLICRGSPNSGPTELGTTYFVRLGHPDILNWITATTSQGGTWILTAAHVATGIDGFPRQATRVLVGADIDSPVAVYNVDETVIHPMFIPGELYAESPDVALLRISVPEPAGLIFIALAVIPLHRFSRRRPGSCQQFRRGTRLHRPGTTLVRGETPFFWPGTRLS